MELRAAEASAHEMNTAVTGARTELEEAKAFAAQAAAAATRESVDQDEQDFQGEQELTKMEVDENAGDVKYTSKMLQKNTEEKGRLREEMYA